MLSQLLSRYLRSFVRSWSLIGTIHNRIHRPSVLVFQQRLVILMLLLLNFRISLVVLTLATGDESWIRFDLIFKWLYNVVHVDMNNILAFGAFVIASEMIHVLYYRHEMFKYLFGLLYDTINRSMEELHEKNKSLFKCVHPDQTFGLSHPIATFKLIVITLQSAFTKGTFADGKTPIRLNTRLHCEHFPIALGRRIRIQNACIWFLFEAILFIMIYLFFVFLMVNGVNALVILNWEESPASHRLAYSLDFITFSFWMFIFFHTGFIMLFTFSHVYITVWLLYIRLNRTFANLERSLRAGKRDYAIGCVYFLSRHTKLTSFLLRLNQYNSLLTTLFFYSFISMNVVIILNLLLGRYKTFDEVTTFGAILLCHTLFSAVAVSFEIRFFSSVHTCAHRFVGVEISLGKSVSLVTRLKWSIYYERLHSRAKMAAQIYGIGTITRENILTFAYIYIAIILYMVRFIKN